jgi:hypothetical protein
MTSFPQPVQMSVTGLPTNYTYSFSPSSTIATGAEATTLTLTIQSTQTQTARTGGGPGTMGAGQLGIWSLALLLLPFAGRLRRAGRRLRGGVLLAVLAAASLVGALALMGCGSTIGFFGQTPQSYPLSITGTSGSLSSSAKVTLAVE